MPDNVHHISTPRTRSALDTAQDYAPHCHIGDVIAVRDDLNDIVDMFRVKMDGGYMHAVPTRPA